MASAIPSSTNSISLTPKVPFITKKTNFLSRCSFPRKLNKQPLPIQKYILPLSTSVRLFPQFRIGCTLKPKLLTHITSATGTESSVTVLDTPEISTEPSPKTDDSSSQAKRSRPSRKSEMPPVNNEELIPGATFTGKVRSIQPFGAFVDFGAFTDGLVHVSQLSDSFVKDVASVVTVGQEVKVRLVEVNMESGRISLTMREKEANSMKDTPGGPGDKSRPPRRTNQKPGQKKDDMKNSKFTKGQDLVGTVKNTTRAGSFITLPEGEEGFLPVSEEADEGFGNMMGGASSLEIGQEVKVRILRFSRGKATLTMKKEEAAGELDAKLRSQGVIHTATNPFMLAFRSNKDISAFLDERENKNKLLEKAEKDAKEASLTEAKENEEEVVLSEQIADVLSEVVEEATQEAVNDEKIDDPVLSLEGDSGLSGELTNETVSDISEEVAEKTGDDVIKTDEDESEKPDASVPSAIADAIENQEEPELSGESADEIVSGISEEILEKTDDDVIAKDEEQIEILDSMKSTDSSATQSEEEIATLDAEENWSIESSSAPIDSLDLETTSTESQVSEEVENLGNGVAVNEVEEMPTSADPQENGNVSVPSGQSSDGFLEETTTKAAISPALVKQLREETGAGMMDCKKALSETEGDIIKAQEYLRKKGLASADKKSSRATSQGRIGSYIHDSRIGVLIEVNCETDFVARGDIFKELVEDLAMQVAACPQVQYLTTDDIPKEIIEKEKEIEMQKEDLLSKPEQFRSKIVVGRISKMLGELALLEQPFIKDDKVVVKDWVKQTISTIGENIKVKRFVRYNLAEGLEKKNQDFAAEVAAQTVAKPVSVNVEKEADAVETKESVEEPPKATVSASLVKQLRDETGAGMMDCKKALTETGGDLEKAQEYLRKKGLSTADKKSSRLAAEGRIGSYIHDSQIGVLIEVNCETDFVGRSQNFKELVDDLAMQIVACPQVEYVSIEDIPESIVNREKQLEMQREDLQSKPENIREKIVEGRIGKRLGELALLEQPFIRDDGLLVKDLVKQSVAGIGENIKVRRFVRFTLGETKDEELATEV